MEKKGIKKLAKIHYNQHNKALFQIIIRSIVTSKAYWAIIIIITIIFILTKSLNLINSIHDSVEPVMLKRLSMHQQVENWLYANPGQANIRNILVQLQQFDSADFFGNQFTLTFRQQYLIQLNNMEIFYNFIIIVVTIFTANISLFKKIKNGSILVYLTAPISKIRIMLLSFAVCFLMVTGFMFVLHTLDTIITSIIYENYSTDTIKTIITDREYLPKAWIRNPSEDAYFTNYSPDADVATKAMSDALAARTFTNNFVFFWVNFLGSAIYIFIILSLVFIVLLFVNIIKTTIIFATLGIALIIVCTIVVRVLDDPEYLILVARILYFPGLINEAIISLLIDSGGFHLSIAKVNEGIVNDTPFHFNLGVEQQNIASITNTIKDLNTGELWHKPIFIYTLVPAAGAIIFGVLPTLHRRIDWK